MRFKGIFSFAATCAIITGTYATANLCSAESKKLLLGDVDGNSQVNSVDASAVLADYAAVSGGKTSKFTNKQKNAADANKDRKIDSVDASRILAYYAYLSTGGKLSFEEYLDSL